ncbi:transglutaminase family protein [Thioflexithrix psekupsensis]|uniref:Transglutaminase n=1 Tax=Thioflexithrix psekupsensis TaxID=1570016 RepID=A0A251XAQ2_9GAMM|nr:transglutaminase family protein [Thioflexithrix psekupsensis]OUD14602.1 transglutaminase [Thioflexithrix psekupsensis]
MKYRVIHKTHYGYSDAVSLCQNEAHLLPRHCVYQQCLQATFTVDPTPAIQQQHTDFFGNQVNYFAIQSPHETLTITADSEVEIQYPGFSKLPIDSPAWEKVRETLETSLDNDVLEAKEFVLDSPFVGVDAALTHYALPSFTPNRPILDAVRDLMKRIFTEFSYDPHFTTIVTPLSEVLAHKRGVCQDFAHLMIACIRSQGLAARYVSGYLETLPPPGQEKLQGSDASHAWIAVFVPEQGWVDFDPTNYQIPTYQHITTAWGRDYSDVTPLKGVIFGGGTHTLMVSVDVNRLD